MKVCPVNPYETMQAKPLLLDYLNWGQLFTKQPENADMGQRLF